jgi:hypothetical protein
MCIEHQSRPSLQQMSCSSVLTFFAITSFVVFLAFPTVIAFVSDEFPQSEEYQSKVCMAYNFNDDPMNTATREPPSCREPYRRLDDTTPPQPLLWILASFIHSWNTIVVPSILVPMYTVLVLVYIGILSLDQFSRGAVLRRFSRLLLVGTDQGILTSSRYKKELLEASVVPPQRVPDVVTQDHAEETTAGVADQEEQPIDMSGSYQMKSHDNLDAFLAIQGVPWPLRRAAAAVYPIHHITHVKNHLRIKIEAKSSGFVTETQYLINGPPVETNVRGRIFSDRVYYSYEDAAVDNGGRKCNGIVTEKRAITEGYLVTVLRQLVVASDDPADSTPGAVQIHMTSTASFPNEPDKADILCKQLFERID